MKHKLLYICLMILCALAWSGNVWGEDGYEVVTSSEITYAPSGSTLNSFEGNYMSLTKTTSITSKNVVSGTQASVKFKFGEVNWSESRLHFTGGGKTITLNWEVDANYTINFTSLYMGIRTSFTGSTVVMTAYNDNGLQVSQDESQNLYTGGISKKLKDVTFNGLSLGNNSKITLKTNQTEGTHYFIGAFEFKYTLSHKELVLTNLTKAITDAEALPANWVSNNSLKQYLSDAITNAKTFKTNCSFPTYITKGYTPSTVNEQANKLNAIVAYLPVLEQAWTYNRENIPDAVWNDLNQFNGYNPNDYDATTINTAKGKLEDAIEAANATTAPYLSAVSTLNTFENEYPSKTTDTAKAAEDLVAARSALEASTSIEAIANALKIVKNFDEITFTDESRIRINKTLSNVASAHNTVSCSSNSSVITASGTTLTAGSTEGTATITASTSTGDGYYAVSATKPFTVYKKDLTLNPIDPDINSGENYDEVTLSRTLKAGYSTIALPFSTTVEELVNGRTPAYDSDDDWVAQLDIVTYSAADGYTLYFQKIAGGIITANQPYVLHLGSQVENPTWTDTTNGITVAAASAASVTPSTGYSGYAGWTMYANYQVGFDMNGKYGIVNSEGGLMLGSGDKAKLNAFTAYIAPPQPSGVPKLRVAYVDEDGTATFIGSLPEEDQQGEPVAIYGPDGQRRSKMQRGVNIVRYSDGTTRKVQL